VPPPVTPIFLSFRIVGNKARCRGRRHKPYSDNAMLRFCVIE
jgi:hypothetical protein